MASGTFTNFYSTRPVRASDSQMDSPGVIFARPGWCLPGPLLQKISAMIHKPNGFFGSVNHGGLVSRYLQFWLRWCIKQSRQGLTTFPNTSWPKFKNSKFAWKNDPMRVIFLTLFSVFGIVVIQTRSFLFDILLHYWVKTLFPHWYKISWRRLIKKSRPFN